MSYVRTVNLNGEHLRGTGPGQDPNAGLLAGRRRRRRESKSAVYVGGLFDDIMNTVTDTSSTVSKEISSGGGDLAQQLINSSQFKIVLDKVEEKAREGVKAEASKNALALFGLAMGAGTVGGVAFGKLPKGSGLIVASGILAASVGWLFVNAVQTAKVK